MSTDLAPGDHVRALRNERGMKRPALARRASMSVSYLEKIENGERPLTPAVAAQIGRAFGLTVEAVMGTAPVSPEDAIKLSGLEDAMRDFDIPEPTPADRTEVGALLIKANELRGRVEVNALLDLLPNLLRRATTFALGENSELGWTALADVYSAVYWLAARHRWRLVAELAVARQQWAASQHAGPVSAALAQRDRAGTYLNFGDVERGLSVVDRAIAAAENALSGADRAYAVGILNLRGMTLAGRLKDKKEARREVARHMKSARATSDEFGPDRTLHGLTFGPGNTETHVLATQVDLGQPREAVRIGADADAFLDGLPETRKAPTYINISRAQLDLGDRDGALENLVKAWEIAPAMARIHPMGREVFRVVSALHRRSNTRLLELSKLSGIDV